MSDKNDKTKVEQNVEQNDKPKVEKKALRIPKIVSAVVPTFTPVSTPILMPTPMPIPIIPLAIGAPVSAVTAGMIRIGQRQMRKSYPSCPGYTQIPAWSGGKGEFKQLSPFTLGPLVIDGVVAENFENAWQYSKVYSMHLDKSNGLPNADWYVWRFNGFLNKEAVRHPMKSEKPVYSYFCGQKLLTVDARKQIYIPFYKELVRKTKAYKNLLERLRRGENLLLIEPDGPNLQDFPEGIEFSRELFTKLVDVTDAFTFHGLIDFESSNANKYFPLGHGYVLADALLEDL